MYMHVCIHVCRFCPSPEYMPHGKRKKVSDSFVFHPSLIIFKGFVFMRFSFKIREMYFFR